MTGETPDVRKLVLEALTARDVELNERLAKVDQEFKAYGTVTSETKDAIAKLRDEGDKLQKQLLALSQELTAPAAAKTQVKSIGQQFVESEQLVAFAKRGAKGNHTSERFEVKTITSVDGSGGSGIWSDRLAGVVQEPLRMPTIRDLLDQGTTDSNLIEWIKETVFTNNADVVSEGALKPESDLQYDRSDVPVRTIAHWVRATRQVLADFPQLATLIDGRLRWGLRLKEEDQILLGDGTGENLLGLIPQATAYNTGLTQSGDTKVDQLRRAALQVRQAFYPATGIVLNPADWASIELQKTTEGAYLFSNPTSGAEKRLWGLQVVESDAMPSGKFMVGAFRLAATLFDRLQAAVYVSTEDRDNFIRNLVTVLCEERIALAVSRPQAFIYGTLV